jgi:threonine/homoserine/homoserine lactone efflux protein
MEEELQKYSPHPTNLLTIIFLLNVIPSFVNEHKPLIDLRIFVFYTFHLSLGIAIMMVFSQFNSIMKARRRMKQLSTVFVLDSH